MTQLLVTSNDRLLRSYITSSLMPQSETASVCLHNAIIYTNNLLRNSSPVPDPTMPCPSPPSPPWGLRDGGRRWLRWRATSPSTNTRRTPIMIPLLIEHRPPGRSGLCSSRDGIDGRWDDVPNLSQSPFPVFGGRFFGR